MEEMGARLHRVIDLERFRSALSTAGWGLVLGALTCGTFTFPTSGSIGIPSVLGGIFLVAGLARLPLATVPQSFRDQRRLATIAVAIGWLCTFVAVVPAVGRFAQPVGSACTIAGIVLFVALMTRTTSWLGASDASEWWRRTNLVAIGLLALTAILGVMTMAFGGPSDPDRADPDATGVMLNGVPLDNVGPLAAVVAIVGAVASLGAMLGAIGLAVQAFRATRSWIADQLEPRMADPTEVPDSESSPEHV